jgi:hypothetical protein
MSGREVIFEFIQVSHSVKVTAVDPETMVEVSIVAPAHSSQANMRAAALRKLQYMLAKRGGSGDGGSKGGISV